MLRSLATGLPVGTEERQSRQRETDDGRRGDGAKAHELSQEGKRHQAEQDKLDDQASDWIYTGEL